MEKSTNWIVERAVYHGVERGVRWAVAPAPRELAPRLNGYVQLPTGHPLRRLGEEVGHYLVVHGGITYGPDEDGWIGWDTSHADDEWVDVPPLFPSAPDRRIVWTPGLVRWETVRLAGQVADLWHSRLEPGRQDEPVVISRRLLRRVQEDLGQYVLILETLRGGPHVWEACDALDALAIRWKALGTVVDPPQEEEA